MIDHKITKARYREMTEGELKQFALEDGGGLTSEAFQILKEEFSNRKMNLDILESITDGSYTKQKDAIRQIEDSISAEFSRSVLAHALNEKRDGKNDEMIVFSLIETGMEEEKARVVISRLEKHARTLYTRSGTAMLTAAFIFVAGVAFYLIIPYTQVVTFMDILAVCAIIFGIIKFFISWFDNYKYITILRNIKKEKTNNIY